MRVIILIALFTLIAGSSIGQTKSISISGYVREAATGEPIPGALIILRENREVASANTSGYYSIKTFAGKYTVSCSSMGYKTLEQEVDLSSDKVLNLLLESLDYSIDEVNVTTNSGTVDNKGLGRLGVNMQQLKYAPSFMGEQDVIKYLQIMPGVTSGKEGSSQLAVRGGGGDQTLIMLDDIPIFNQNHAFGFVSIFNGDATSGAELYKGYVPAMYGGRLSAVASLKMRDGNKYEHHQSLSIGTLTASILAEGPITKGKGSYIVSARRFIPDLMLRAFWALQKENSFELLYSFYDVNAKVNHQIGDKNTLFLSFYNGRDKMSIDARGYKSEYTIDYTDPDQPFMILTGRSEVSKSGHGFRWGNLSGSVRLNTLLGNSAFMNNSVYYSGLTNKQESFVKDHTVPDSFMSDVDSKMSEMGFRSSIEQKVGEIHSLSYGLNLSMQEFTPQNTIQNRNGIITKRSFDNRTLYTSTLFAEDEITTGIFKFNIGSRFSMFHNKTTAVFAIEPRLATRAQLDSKNSVWLSYTRSTQPLFTSSQMFMGFPLDFWLPYTGDKLESSDQVSVGWKTSPLTNLAFTVEGYYKRFNNLSYIVSLDDYLMNPEDVLPATGKAYGVEFMAQYNLRRFSMIGSYTYSRSLRTIEGETFPFTYDMPHNLNIYANYTTLQKNERTHTLSLNVNYRTGIPFTVSNTVYPFIGDVGSLSVPIEGYMPDARDILENPIYPNARMKPYFRTDISYTMEKKMKKGTRTWQISIMNATGHINPHLIYRDEGKYKYATIMPFMPAFSYKRTF